MVFKIEDLVRETFFQICLAMHLREIVVALSIKAYIDKTDHETILSIISAACLPCLPSLFKCLTNGFDGVDFVSLESPLQTSKQGVYLVVVLNKKWKFGFRLYVGSSWGEQGLVRRVFKDHANEKFRTNPRNEGKFLYQLMAEPGTTWKFVCLAVFKEKQPKQLILLIEAIMCAFFNTYRLPIYTQFRSAELPIVDRDIAVNRSDPLAPEGHVLTNIHINRQYRTWANAMAGGPQNISLFQDGRFCFQIFNLDFTLPKQLGIDWGLPTSPFVDVTFDLSPTRHEFLYATLCNDTDDGCRLGVSVSKIVGKLRYQWWLELPTMEGIRTANSLVDWLEEKVKDPKTHQWGWDRVAFFGPLSVVKHAHRDAKWQERLNAAQSGLYELVRSRRRRGYNEAGADVVPIDINHGTKRKLAEMMGGEEGEEKEEEEDDECFSARDIWNEQADLTRKYLTDNHQYLMRQGVYSRYFEISCSYV